MKKYNYHFSTFEKGGEPIDIYLTATSDAKAWDKLGVILTMTAFSLASFQSKEEVEI